MRKKDKLYTVNRWNRPAFMPNVYWPGGVLVNGSSSTFMNNAHSALSKSIANPLSSPGLLSDSTMSIVGSQIAQQNTQNYLNSKNILGISKKNNPFSKVNMAGVGKAVGNAALGIGANLVGSIGSNLIGGGLQSDAGAAISNIGGTVAGAIGSVNPIAGAVVGVGSQLLGGLTNRMFGSKLNQENINKINESNAAINATGKAMGNASSNEDVLANASNLDMGNDFSQSYVGSDGWFSNKAKRKYEELKRKQATARAYATHALTTGAQNADMNMDDDILSNFAAFGGPIETNDMGAIEYGFMSDLLTNKQKKTEQSNTPGNLFAGMPGSMFALGGDMQMHGGDYSTGLMHIDEGGSHEANPNDGVQLGVDNEGTPNLVEEGETVWNDYVFSNRILADEATKQMFKLPKKKDVTFADISKKLEKEISERPSDPISKAGFEAQMQTLEEQQERQKSEMDAQRAKAAFEALSPEEQVAVMENAAQQEAMTKQAAMQQPSPEEIAMAQQQQAMADGSQAALGQEPQMNCFGGRINRFDNGGQAYTKMLNSLGFHTQKEFDDWAKENSIDFGDIWKDNPNTLSIDILGKLWSNEKFKEALKKKNPALAHAFETKGYDFGTYVPTSNSRATIQSISKGNWKATNGQGWFGSEDLAFKQATEGMSENEIKALTTEQLAERMAKTDAYKNTSKWLENSDNALMYLNTLLHDPDTPDVAKKHALQYVKDGKWKDGYKYNYNDVFGKVRSTNPGTYWHTAMEANRGNEANNFVINEDGSIEPILGNVPTDWTSAGNYSWADENSDYTYNYYKRPAVAAKPEAAKTPEEKEAEEEKGVAPKHRAEWLRYAGLFGPAVGLGMMAAGVGRPDTAQLDAAVAGAGDVNTADWKPLGNYLTYRPLDIWFEQNRLNANARATDRAILNSGVNQGSKMAGLLAAGYNDQIASGNLFRQAQEYNDNLRKQVAEFNRGTDQFNSEQYGATSRFNADAYNNARRANTQLRLQAAAQKMDADAGWYNSLYGNIAGLFKGIGDIGTENFRMNRIGEMAARGDFGTATDETYGFEPYLTRSNRKSKKNR